MHKFYVKIQRKSIDTTIVDTSVQVCESFMTVITQAMKRTAKYLKS